MILEHKRTDKRDTTTFNKLGYLAHNDLELKVPDTQIFFPFIHVVL